MTAMENPSIRSRIDRIKVLSADDQGYTEYFEAASLALAVLYDTVGSGHPLMAAIDSALKAADWARALAASRSVITLHEQGALKSPRLEIAREIEGDLLDMAQAQVEAAGTSKDQAQMQVQIAVAAFLAGAALEDALRRLCDARGLPYDTQRTSISKLQGILFQPIKQIQVISGSENKQITAWGDTRNKADHGRFGEITYTEVQVMVIGVRAFVDKHLS